MPSISPAWKTIPEKQWVLRKSSPQCFPVLLKLSCSQEWSPLSPWKSHLWNSLLWSQSSLLPFPLLVRNFLFFILIFQKQLLILCYLSHPDKDIVSDVCMNVSINQSAVSEICTKPALLSILIESLYLFLFWLSLSPLLTSPPTLPALPMSFWSLFFSLNHCLSHYTLPWK